jgi:Zn ribbon nucleic-acid-binding protein
MSKKITAKAICPTCRRHNPVTLYRTIWIENPGLRDLVFTDQVNMVRCPGCGHTERAPIGLLATNSGAGIAVWYEPSPDPQIDADAQLYRSMPGMRFLADAPRMRTWVEFKAKILQLEAMQSSKQAKAHNSGGDQGIDLTETHEALQRWMSRGVFEYAASRANKNPPKNPQHQSYDKPLSPAARFAITFLSILIGLLVFFVITFLKR